MLSWYLPLSQVEQEVCPVDAWEDPARQEVQVVEEVAAVVVEYLPEPHAVQVEEDVAAV